MVDPNTTHTPMIVTVSEAKLRFLCEQLREWGGLPEDEIRRIYEAESKRLVRNAE